MLCCTTNVSGSATAACKTPRPQYWRAPISPAEHGRFDRFRTRRVSSINAELRIGVDELGRLGQASARAPCPAGMAFQSAELPNPQVMRGPTKRR